MCPHCFRPAGQVIAVPGKKLFVPPQCRHDQFRPERIGSQVEELICFEPVEQAGEVVGRLLIPPQMTLGGHPLGIRYRSPTLGQGVKSLGPAPLAEHAHERAGEYGRQGGDQGGIPWIAAAPPPRPAGRPHRPGQHRLASQEPPQVVGQRHGRGVPAGRVFLQTLEADGVQVAGDGRLQSRRRDRLGRPHLVQRLAHGGCPERRPGGQALVQDRSEGINIRRRPNGLGPARLFGGHVAGGTD